MTTTAARVSRGARRGGRFGLVLARGRRYDGELLQLIVGAAHEAPAELGLIVGRKVLPKAVARNRARRLLREAYRQNSPALAGSIILLRLRQKPRDPAMRDIFSEACALLARAAGN